MQHRLIYSIAWGFTNGNPQLFEELHSEATLAYLEAEQKYDPTKGVLFTTYIWQCMRNRLIDFTKKENQYFPTDEFPEIGYETVPFFEIYDSLSDRAKQVVDHILKHMENYNDLTPWQVRGKIGKELMDLGWSNNKKNNTFNELKKIFT